MTPLLTLPSSCLPHNQYFTVAKQHPRNHFYHALASQHYLILVDERFPGHPVLQWPHLLSSPPICLSIIPSAASFSEEDLFFTMSNSSRETHFFQCSSLTGETPHAAKAPGKIQDNDAWLDLMSTIPNRNGDFIRRRLASPLIGMCATKANLDEDRVTVFQMTEIGDIFHQVMRVTDPVAMTSDCNNRRGRMNHTQERRCQEFIEKILQIEGSLWEDRNLVATSPVSSAQVRKEMVQPVVHKSECILCYHSDGKSGGPSAQYIKGAVACNGCGLKNKYSRSLKKDPTANVLTSKKTRLGKSVLLFDPIKKGKVKDKLGRRLREGWRREHLRHLEEVPFSAKKEVKSIPPKDSPAFISPTSVGSLGEGFHGNKIARHPLTPSRLRVSLTKLPSSSLGLPAGGAATSATSEQDGNRRGGHPPTPSRLHPLTPSKLKVSLKRLPSPSLKPHLESGGVESPRASSVDEPVRTTFERDASNKKGVHHPTPSKLQVNLKRLSSQSLGLEPVPHGYESPRRVGAVTERDVTVSQIAALNGSGQELPTRMAHDNRTPNVLSPPGQTDLERARERAKERENEDEEGDDRHLPRFSITDSPPLFPSDDEFPMGMLTQRASPLTMKKISPLKEFPRIGFLPKKSKASRKKVHSLGF